jgi:uncharacterized protein DUF6968
MFERTLDLIPPNGDRTTFTVSLGPAYPFEESFRCPVKFTGWGKSPPDMFGFDSLQALLLAVGMVHGILSAFVAHGGRVLYSGTDSDFDLSHFNISTDGTPTI